MQDEASTSIATALIGQRYRLLHLIGRGGMGRVYCALDRLTGRQVALKQLELRPGSPPEQLHSGQAVTLIDKVPPAADSAEGSTPGSHGPYEVFVGTAATEDSIRLRLALENEFSTLASLRHPNIVSVLDYGFDPHHGPYLALELLIGAVPFGHDPTVPLAQQVALIAQILRALGYLHRRGVLHRDLKPGNALVLARPQRHMLKVLDFGLALAQDQTASLQREIVGTPGYIAPEVLLGAAPSIEADLFAVGAIAYEVLTGQPAFPVRDGEDFIEQAFREVDPRPLSHLGSLGELVLRLLARAPDRRWPSALAALDALAACTGRPELGDDTEVRDSFVIAARFVGREAETKALRLAFERCRTGHGETWLIAGESGIGKSRLLDELARHTLVHNAIVARGQAVAQGGRAYRLFVDALHLLCLHVTLSDRDAGVLKTLLPDLEILLERVLPEAPQLSAQATQARLWRVIQDLFGALPVPLVLLLEDLHWADEESLALLRHLASALNDWPILIVGSYRSEEAPALAQSFPSARTLQLKRLDARSIAALTESMLGPTGRRPEVLALIERESEGNSFFVTEVVRTLASQAGRLSWVAKGALPERVASYGVQALLERRLAAVPAWAYKGLNLAAVLGRQLDLTVLGTLVSDPEKFLAACADTAVLEVREDAWRFTHDKLREFLLARMSPEATQQAHFQVAEAIAAVYSGAALAAHSAAVAEHYQRAGRLAQAASFHVGAAEVAYAQGALEAAAAHCRMALGAELRPRLETFAQARALRIWVQSLFGLRRSDECLAVYQNEYRELGSGSLVHAAWLVISTFTEGVQQFRLHRRVPGASAPPAHIRELLREQFFFNTVSIELLLLRGQLLGALRGLLRCLNIADTSTDDALRAIAYSGFAYALTLMSLHRLASQYQSQAEQQLQRVQEPVALLEVKRVIGLIYAGRGEFARARADFTQALQTAEELGHEEGRMFCLATLITIERLQGNQARIVALCEQLEQAARRAEHFQYLSGVAMTRAWISLRAGRLAEAQDLLALAQEWTQKMKLPVTVMAVNSYRALLAARTGDPEGAIAYADQTLSQAAAERSTGPSLMIPAAALFEAMFVARDGTAQEGARRMLMERARQVVTWMRLIAKRFPVCRAQLALATGQLAEQKGDRQSARQSYQEALDHATRLGLKPDLALGHYLMGRLSARSGGQQAAARFYLRSAHASFQRLGSTEDAANAARLLAAYGLAS